MGMFSFYDFNIRSVVNRLAKVGGTSFPVLPDDLLEYLLSIALLCHYIQRERVVGVNKVHQDLSGVDEFPPGSPFYTFRDEWQSLFLEKLRELPENIFADPLCFTELSLQLYEVGSQGITPHMDGQKYINLVCIFTLTGNCRFSVCKDRDGKGAIALDSSPGNVILLRAPGFLKSEYRPFHVVTDIQGPRISFGLRQKR